MQVTCKALRSIASQLAAVQFLAEVFHLKLFELCQKSKVGEWAIFIVRYHPRINVEWNKWSRSEVRRRTTKEKKNLIDLWTSVYIRMWIGINLLKNSSHFRHNILSVHVDWFIREISQCNVQNRYTDKEKLEKKQIDQKRMLFNSHSFIIGGGRKRKRRRGKRRGK